MNEISEAETQMRLNCTIGCTGHPVTGDVVIYFLIRLSYHRKDAEVAHYAQHSDPLG